jgi:hypothetical protein
MDDGDWLFHSFDIFIAYIEWEGGGKSRPVLVLEKQDKSVNVFKITTQYENKSDAIRSQYFKILDWQFSGLAKQSYVDTNSIQLVPLSAFHDKSPIGRLSEADTRRLTEFLRN